ncbi:VWA domain-containing protein [Mycobacteroides salmoniphilum]|uniref:VWA domain containing CoxE-like protein n=1 Tax=Mycobacteroides salmoniphilum TaxID=404941 RepID=A0A4R8SSX2_9MYCO|nr:VWA domain-containing protein [Mycobacteroides salmoniphilum]TDZ93976.1 VWA domain containing CoxE-like protein [Mycobacteroides salmoniphilum]TEA03439.1 VWA domain containing CoxE-like protein [Mycobacteroides salmoniphilum]
MSERDRRWRLVLGEPSTESLGALSGDASAMDKALAALYDGDRKGGLGSSAPSVARWLGDIRKYFPSTVVQVMQKDAVERLNLAALLVEPELIETVEANVDMVATLISLGKAIPETSRASARAVVAKVVAEIERRIADKTRTAVGGALNRAARTQRPRPGDIDWNRTIGKNLKNYLPEQKTIVPERLVGYARRSQIVGRDIVLAIDQSGSMANSIVYSSVFGAVLASIRAVHTSLVLFDTEIVDLTDKLADPVDVLFGATLGGGTDINRAIAYCQGLITRPRDSVFVLISDLYEGGLKDKMLARTAQMKAAGIQVIVLLALSDEGAPAFDREIAAALATMEIPAFACTPDMFPDLLAQALTRGDINAWVAKTLPS